MSFTTFGNNFKNILLSSLIFSFSSTNSLGKAEKELSGFADLHTHLFANEGFGGKFFQGKAFHENGISSALTHSPYSFLERPWVGVVEKAMGVGKQNKKEKKKLEGWSRYNQSNRQTMYYEWLKRAKDGGLRFIIVDAVNNAVLCKLVPKQKGVSCDDMEVVSRQIDAAYELQGFVDDEAGGEGKGWFRIVTSPDQARKVIKEDKLAVMLGIEVDSLFNCKLKQCDMKKVEEDLLQYKAKGVRHIFPIHLFDNGFGGAAIYQSGALTVANLLDQGSCISISRKDI